MTRSGTSRKLFPKSKVIDERGNLRVVYHGTKRQFDEFRFFPVFFSDRAEIASIHAQGTRAKGSAPNVRPVFLDIQNPLVILDNYGHYGWGRINIKRGDKRAAMQWLMSKDYDGVVFRDSKNGPEGTTEFVVFHPCQIRSVYWGQP